MAQNIYDQPEFFMGYSKLPRSIHGLGGAPEWPAIQELLPPLAGRRVVDLGCGFGWFARWATEQGAASVLGLDLSQRMIERAKAETGHPAIEYRIADLEHLELPKASFDLAYSSLVFHYIEDFDRLAKTVHHAIVRNGHFVFSIEHPIYMAAEQPGWLDDGSGRMTWPVRRYAAEGPRRTDWLARDVLKYHRTIGTTLNALIGAGFTIRHVQEWAPTAGQVAASPALAEELERPMILLVACQR
ncbi:class I SAM-dependent methyltransferase [Geminicoccus roseus]|uniref:class I SAM-dependent methyltransferase n=1 Tax=Geminicoccus roseus TaxID=404900 RepID=UPI0004196DB8|nr:class I SAM-dependent methyltransferase [Geminicoccus roseus]